MIEYILILPNGDERAINYVTVTTKGIKFLRHLYHHIIQQVHIFFFY